MVVTLGWGSFHDVLFAAALRSCGIAAEAAPCPTDEALAIGRSLIPRGHPCSIHYLAGAAVLCARAARDPGSLRFVVPGDRCGAYAADLQRALGAVNAHGASVFAVAPERALDTLWRHLGAEPGELEGPLLEALSAGDVLLATRTAIGTGRRAAVVDACLAVATRDAVAELEARGDVLRVWETHRTAIGALAASVAPTVRVRVTGELLPSLTDGDVSADLVRWMESLGARVERPSMREWALYHAWRAGVGEGDFAALRRALGAARARHAGALGLTLPRAIDPTEWAEAARAWLPVSLSAGSGFIELATYMAVERDASADLVVSLKPFASLLSSSVSDAVLYALARDGSTAFLALELNGDARAQMQSRVELALDTAPRHHPRSTEFDG